MPELPEVEGARRLAERNCVGKTIEQAVVADDEKVIQGIAPAQLAREVQGKTITAARRLGKHLWFELGPGSPSLLFHFGMTGGLVVRGVGAAHYKSFAIDDSAWPPRFCKVELRLGDGTELAFCDSRRFARVRLIADPEGEPPLSELGWDPLLRWPPAEEFAAALAKQRRVIKALLLDQADYSVHSPLQSFTAGVGNWVADECLYQARIHPEQPAASLTAQQAADLHRIIREVCSVASEVEADADRLPKDWLFHVRWGKGSKEAAKIGGHAITHITVGGRTSAIVPALQKLSKAAASAAAAAAAGAAAAPKGAGGKKKRGRKGEEGAGAVAAVAEEGVGTGEVAQEGGEPGGGPAPAAGAAVGKQRGRGGGPRKRGAAATAKAEEAAGAEEEPPGVSQGAGSFRKRRRAAAAEEGDGTGKQAAAAQPAQGKGSRKRGGAAKS